ncbi:unnamed protein product [Chondrus crispus]|uniref:Uncharacterized protein n=1 Tax=Chondrus crispus TaxID=2769 RepID=R7QGP7_CHOCR|nr:unnamed protein product [Chondrus crispus]CDF37692.1 unnamed protein product [Chondrus crispus]|eukprot:XP_005717563.1 unnamed protein product [Chondrus crispus]
MHFAICVERESIWVSLSRCFKPGHRSSIKRLEFSKFRLQCPRQSLVLPLSWIDPYYVVPCNPTTHC